MLCPAHVLGVMSAIHLARRGASYGVRELAPAVCRSGLPGRAPCTRHIRDRSVLLTPLHALIRFIRPFQLHRVAADFLGLPRADVADFAVGVVIPAFAGNGIGDGLAQFVRAG